MILSVMSINVYADSSVPFDDSEVLTDTLLLVNASTDEVLYSKNSDVKRPIASITKIMSCIVALESIENPESYMIEITEEPIADVMNQGAACAGFENHIGQTYSAIDIIYGMMVPSGCEAAQILAYEVGADATADEFAVMMNNKAEELGCENTYFTEAHGLSDENYSTAEDLLIITEYAMQNPLFREIVSTEYYQPEGFSAPFFNTNQLIAEENNRGLYNRYVTGVKTGFTTLAGRCLASSATKGEDSFFCIALGGYNGTVNHAMKDTAALYDWAFANYTENIDIDIENSYASVGIGESVSTQATITNAPSGEDSVVSWYSSNENVATVDENGTVYGISEGQAKITAMTPTGNFDTLLVSVGFYNGITVSSRDGDYTTGVKEDVDWNAIKRNGFDFAVIRAGWGSEDYPNQNDPQFVTNVKGAAENNIPFYLSFIAYASNSERAVAEAEYFLREMEEYFPEEGKKHLVSVVYNMTDSSFYNNSAQLNTDIALAFAQRLGEHGYDTLICANKTVFSNMDIDTLLENNVGIYYRYYPYIIDFSSPATPVNAESVDMWEYRSDGYFPQSSQNGYTTLCVSYEKPLPKYDPDDTKPSTEDETKPSTEDETKPSEPVGNKGILGDATGDGSVNIKDATAIQKAIALLITLSEEESMRAEVNGDGMVNIKDATAIQKFVAGMEVPHPIGEEILY